MGERADGQGGGEQVLGEGENWEPDKRAESRVPQYNQHFSNTTGAHDRPTCRGAQLALAQFTRILHSSSERRILHRTRQMTRQEGPLPSTASLLSALKEKGRVDGDGVTQISSTAVARELMLLTRGSRSPFYNANRASGAAGDTG